MGIITEEFRKAMNWAHTWLGVALGVVLFAVFWMGSLTVFSQEIDRWMIPETRIVGAADAISYDRLLDQMPGEARDSDYLNFVVPGERSPTIGFFYRDAQSKFQSLELDPTTAQPITLTQSEAASGFIYPFHFTLTLNWADLGMWIVGFAALGMLLLLATGLFIHRKIIAEFFVFRPQRKARRATLDLHNLTSLVGLPFYFLISFSGLLIFAFNYLPWASAEPFGGDSDALYAEMSGAYQPGERTGLAVPLASLDAMKAEAERLWSEAEGRPVETNIVRVLNYGDESAVVYFRNTFPEDRVVLSKYVAVFDGPSGKLIRNFSRPPINEAKGWVEGAHFVQIDHWPLRWLYFLGGLTGCVMIATGMLFWLRARERQHESGAWSFRVMETLTIAGTTGIIAATGAFLVANRLLPRDAAAFGLERAGLEIAAFWAVWLAALVHAARLRSAAWAQQCWSIAGLALLAVALNAATTGHHMIAAMIAGLWPIAVMDAMLVAAACLAGWAAFRLQPRVARALPDRVPAPAE
ncbi:MAG: PepSY-associated TM helix domain-containing protein [Erythrobacter sp.]|jgi:uncharacterized iron-regulated membrane protein